MAITDVLDTEPRLPHLALERCMREAARHCGKTLSSQMADIARLTFGAGKLDREEYFYFRLYDDARYDMAARRAFVGKAIEQRLHAITNHIEWYAAANDKLLCYAQLAWLGFPVPETQAVYRRGAAFPGITTLDGPEALMAYLRRGLAYPAFGKPVTGIRSVGVLGLQRYDAEADAVVLADGRQVGVHELAEALAAYVEDGYLFQHRLTQHPEMAAVCGDALGTVRLIVLLDDDGPQIFRSLWKVPAAGSVADNFWRQGNMLAAVDPESGRIWRAIRGVGPELEELEAHPDSGEALVGRTLPLWGQVRERVLAAAAGFPQLRMQAWDVAIGPDGPVLVELNVGGDYNLPQLVSGEGMLDARFRAFLARCAERRGMQKVLKRMKLA